MTKSPVRYVLTALVFAATMTAHAAPAPAQPATPRETVPKPRHFGDGSESYRGYQIRMARDVPNAEIEQLRRAAEHQVDMVESTALDEGTKAFLRRFNVVVRSGSGEGSHYSGGDEVAIAVDNLKDDRPILLHEFMHVYHFRRMPGGRNNPDILAFFQRARDGSFYPKNSYVLKNQAEFFAMTASVYLHGKLAREPFTRDELLQKQPVYYRYLGRLFRPAER